MVKVVITRVPFKYISYYHYLILGFHQLSKKGVIKFIIRPGNIFDWVKLRFYRITNRLRRSLKFLVNYPYYDYCLSGYVVFEKRKIKFCYDIADCPYFFDANQLSEVDIYFKAQCPIEINDEGFNLTENVILPYIPETLTYKKKIKPSMLGPGFRISNIFSYRDLNREYEKLLNSNVKKTGILMCYFGNSKGPKPVYNENPDLYNNDSDIIAHFNDKIVHPNEKRAIAAKMISEMGEFYDGRVLNEGYSDSSDLISNSHLFIPLEKYSAHIARFRYNLNISGNRMSIPFRFILSFAVGTAIITDKLAVKWYKPFGKEVVETIEMGYLKPDQVNWDKFAELIKNPPEITKEEVKKEFLEKWTPEAFASYIVDSCLKT